MNQQATDTRRNHLFALHMQIAIAKREADETRGRPFPDAAEVAERDAEVRRLEERHHQELWRGCP